ncbi:cyclase family protein [Streptomyces sp. V4I2]|uniref:cyclase family protein n=1 Tax=Streptomyces sp. V4I2 TaxID=3042280 RepID=UPI00278B2039|nr:cyclase family protein [Streptomyces sp. V4I2]MDQ1045425.1 cyclase [Streptomyces sp. V4I2]
MFVDLSIPVSRRAPGVEFEQWLHRDGIRHLSRRIRALPGDSRRDRFVNHLRWLTGSRRLREQDLPDGCFMSNEFYRMSVHQGTHVDAPFHYGPECEGRPAKKVMDLPLEWFHGHGVVLDVRGCGGRVTAADVKEALRTAGREVGPGWVALFRTDADLRLGTPAYYTESTAITPEAVDLLLDLGVKVLGTDCWSFDGPARRMVEDFFATGDSGALWPTHLHGRRREFIQIEGLARLRTLPDGPFTFMAFPIALADAGAAWCRAVARTGPTDPAPR